MFDVLTFVYDHYDAADTGCEPQLLERKLEGVGFDPDEIDDALAWLQGLERAAHPQPVLPWLVQPLPTSVRIYAAHEQQHLRRAGFGVHPVSGNSGGAVCTVARGGAGAGHGGTRLDPIRLEDLKVIILLVYWRFGHEPDALVLDELWDHGCPRVAH